MKRFFLLAALLAVLALTLGGCSSSTSPEVPAGENFAPYTATDEASADFGDPDIAAELKFPGETLYDDPVAVSPLIDSVELLDQPDIFCFRMVWGNLARDSGITELSGWSGRLTISRGAIVVTHLIQFEPGQDYVLPRYDSTGQYILNRLAWVSQTMTGFDGLATRLFIPPVTPDSTDTTPDVVTLTYESRRLTITFTMDDLESLDTMITFGPGNAISFQSARCEAAPFMFTRGPVVGRWGVDTTGLGIFYGRWMTNMGLVIGAVRGEWGTDSLGVQYFVGKYVDGEGKFEGFVKGIWRDKGHGANSAGQFRGRIFNADREPIGVIKGHFKKGETRTGGFFAGRWCVGGDCFAAPM